MIFSKTKFGSGAQHHKKNNPFRKFLATALYNDGPLYNLLMIMMGIKLIGGSGSCSPVDLSVFMCIEINHFLSLSGY